MGDLEIFVRCPGDFRSVSWRYLIAVLQLLIGVSDIFDVSWRYLVCVLEIFDRSPGNI